MFSSDVLSDMKVYVYEENTERVVWYKACTELLSIFSIPGYEAKLTRRNDTSTMKR